MNKEFKIFMKNVAWLRKQHKLSKKKMAQIMGIGVGSLTQIEKGIFPERLRIDACINIQRHFGVSVKDQLQKYIE
ncbi:MAG: helix-turn-helix transcriptional regulator [Oscillospiraceae bacterium]|nr:helix-turn-helix transcriptional regulator [Oscillospiraceae bacterium]